MAFLDKFNHWYLRKIQNDELLITWKEPVAGSRYRWKKERSQPWGLIVVGLAVLIPWPGKHGEPSGPLKERLIFGAVFICVLFIAAWAFSFKKQKIYLSKLRIRIGNGKNPPRLRIDDDAVKILIERIGDYQTLGFTKDGKEELRVFLDPSSEAEVLGIVANLELSRTTPSPSKS